MKIIRLAISLLDEKMKQEYYKEISKRNDITEMTKDQIIKLSTKQSRDDDNLNLMSSDDEIKYNENTNNNRNSDNTGNDINN